MLGITYPGEVCEGAGEGLDTSGTVEHGTEPLGEAQVFELGGAPGGGRRNQRKGKGKGKNRKQQRFGNPARAEAEARKEQERLAKKASQEIGSAFGAGADPKDFDPSQLDLPKGFEKYLK